MNEIRSLQGLHASEDLPVIEAQLRQAIDATDEALAVAGHIYKGSEASEAATTLRNLDRARQELSNTLGIFLLAVAVSNPDGQRSHVASRGLSEEQNQSTPVMHPPVFSESDIRLGEWEEGVLLSDPSLIRYPTSIGENTGGALDMDVQDQVLINGVVREGGLVFDDVTTDDAPPGLTAYAIQTFIREGVRRGAKTLTAAVVSPAVMRMLIHKFGIENITWLNEDRYESPTTQELLDEYGSELKEPPKSSDPERATKLLNMAAISTADIQVDLTSRRARKFLNKKRR